MKQLAEYNDISTLDSQAEKKEISKKISKPSITGPMWGESTFGDCHLKYRKPRSSVAYINILAK